MDLLKYILGEFSAIRAAPMMVMAVVFLKLFQRHA
jgi:hypothetical protein